MPATPYVRLDSSRPAVAAGWDAPPTVPRLALRGDPAGRATLADAAGRSLRTWADPLDALRWLDAERRATPGAAWIGFLSYDLGRRFEHLPDAPPADPPLPLFAFTLHHPADAPAVPPPTPRLADSTPWPESNFTRDDYLVAVRRAIEYVAAGDVFQVNLAQRLTRPLAASPAAIYRRLLERAPAAYAACLDYGDFALVCNSPELFLRVDPDGRVVTRPIKGTRPNAPGMADELLASEKDAAELNMIVDLERNDLGRVCATGSVRVTRRRSVEAHPTVLHGVATVEGALRPGVGLVELLAATFPGGSITGAPKIRAMQVIDELEPHARGPYCGAVGRLDADGSITLNVAIRTLVGAGGAAHVYVGGGVVADSDPATEYDETLVKARAILAALAR